MGENEYLRLTTRMHVKLTVVRRHSIGCQTRKPSQLHNRLKSLVKLTATRVIRTTMNVPIAASRSNPRSSSKDDNSNVAPVLYCWFLKMYLNCCLDVSTGEIYRVGHEKWHLFVSEFPKLLGRSYLQFLFT